MYHTHNTHTVPAHKYCGYLMQPRVHNKYVHHVTYILCILFLWLQEPQCLHSNITIVMTSCMSNITNDHMHEQLGD